MNGAQIVPDICTGSALMCRRFGAWLLPGTLKGAAARLSAAALGTAFFVPLLFSARPLAAVAFALWCGGAWLTQRAGHRRAAAEDAFVRLLHEAIGDANGTLLADVLVTIQRAGHLREWAVNDVRKLCERLGIRVTDAIKVSGRTSVGVHRDDLNAAWPAVRVAPSPAPLASPSPPGSSAGQSGTTFEASHPTEGVTCITQVPARSDDAGVEDAISDALDLFREPTPQARRRA
ncbi:hypothetical protein [Streptomyces sp. RKAG337]|uniref:hypothetical protein n=1 Tax=Streptomyces sp. RKAG337 TaxID=2893404 RepID=UPI00203417E0|nr:hypothetical protein [Streptomyces sp. RKAG337]MCM2427374.1 hypothetical protein [Streptomyces sp. RKAG337]